MKNKNLRAKADIMAKTVGGNVAAVLRELISETARAEVDVRRERERAKAATTERDALRHDASFAALRAWAARPSMLPDLSAQGARECSLTEWRERRPTHTEPDEWVFQYLVANGEPLKEGAYDGVLRRYWSNRRVHPERRVEARGPDARDCAPFRRRDVRRSGSDRRAH